MSPDPKPGITHRLTYTVPDTKTVPRLYPEYAEFQQMPEVFATGFLVGLIEGASQRAIKPYLDWPAEQAVGTQVSFSHLAATPPGLTITVDCEVVGVDGRRVGFRAHTRRPRPHFRGHARADGDRCRPLQPEARRQARAHRRLGRA